MALPNVSIGEASLRGLLGVILLILAMDALILFGTGTGAAAAAVLTLVGTLAIATAVTRVCPVYLMVHRPAVATEGE